jgi:hypothetical protein
MKSTINDDSLTESGMWTCCRVRQAGRKTVMVRLEAICVMLALIAMPARAASRVSPEELAACKALTEHVADLIRAGQTVIATRSQLRRCVRIRRAELRRAGREAVDQARSDAAQKRP